MTNAALNAQNIQLLLKIENGQDAGVVYQMAATQLFIGRSEENDIVLHDPKVSRKHAMIEWNGQDLLIRNLSQSSKITVDGQEVDEASLSENSQIKIGGVHIRLVSENAIIEQAENHPQEHVQVEKKKRKPIFYIYILLGFAFLYLLLSDEVADEKWADLRDEQSIQNEIDEAKKVTELLQNAKYTSGKDSKQYFDAQEAYLKGFRDYREGKYTRAITSFAAALALYPKHPLAKQYMNLSRRKLDEQIQFFMQEGNRYMDKGKYNFAISAYKNVMILIKDPTNPNYKEALAKFKKCNAIIEGNF